MPDPPADEGFSKLDLGKIAETAEHLEARVRARFPERGLDRVAVQLVRLVVGAAADVKEIARPRWRLRIAIGVLVLVILALFVIGAVIAFQDAGSDIADLRSFDWLAITESAVNDLVFGGIALFFLLSVERRHKRTLALAALHRLRSFAHVIDMHQLTKDPERMAGRASETSESPAADLTPDQLGRYLDYCSELLSIIGKVAAVYAEATSDNQVLATVNEIETLTVGLSRKIWQKITILHVTSGGPPPTPVTSAA